MNPSQEPAEPQRPGLPPADPTAEPLNNRTPGHGPGLTPGHGHGTGGDAADGYGPGGSTGAGAGFDGPGNGNGGWSGEPYPDGAAHYGLAHPLGAEGYQGAGGRGWVQRSSPRPWRRTVVVSVLSALVVLVLGGPLGLIWAWIAPAVPVVDAGQSGIVVNDPSPEEYIAADGWFTLLGLAFGLVVAIIAWLVLRRDRGPFLLLGVVAGTLGAGYLVAPWVGERIGRGDYQHWRDTATQGATYLAPPEVHSLGPMLVPAFVAAVVLTLLAGWSNDPDLDRPGAQPGYGPNSAATGQAPQWPDLAAREQVEPPRG